MWVYLRCPVCHVRAQYNGRGQCSCRKAYLLHSFAGRTVELPEHTFRWTPNRNGDAVCVYDHDVEERGYWQPMTSGLYQRPDARRRIDSH